MIKKKPYFLFLISILIVLIYSLFRGNDNLLDINIHDTYFVIKEIDLLVFVVSFLLSLTLIYFIFDLIKFKMIFTLSVIHIYGTLLLLLLFFGFYFNMQLPIPIDRYYIITNYSEDYNFSIIIILLLILFLQLLFILNIFASLIKKMRWLRASQ